MEQTRRSPSVHCHEIISTAFPTPHRVQRPDLAVAALHSAGSSFPLPRVGIVQPFYPFSVPLFLLLSHRDGESSRLLSLQKEKKNNTEAMADRSVNRFVVVYLETGQ